MFSQKINKFLVKTVSTSLLCVFLINMFPTLASADVSTDASLAEKECLPAVLFLKGSGENIDEDGNSVEPITYMTGEQGQEEAVFSTNGHEGAVLSRLLGKFANETTISNIGNKVRFVGIPYPANDVLPNFDALPEFSVVEPLNSLLKVAKHVFDYHNSYTEGAANIAKWINSDPAGEDCKTQYMLVGYSQGVISLRLALNLLGNKPNRVISTYVVGDPWQKSGATIFPDHSSEANTSRNTNGVGRLAVELLNTIKGSASNYGISLDMINAMVDWGQSLNKSDSLIYEPVSLARPVTSRALCHYADPTCGVNLQEINMDAHLNYFDSTTPAGSVDVEHEVEEFDKQIKNLISSAYNYSQDRELNQTPSVKHKETIYNLTYLKKDDKCFWDENSDGTIEASNRDCRIGYKMTAKGGVNKMTVMVRDLDGVENTYSSEDIAAEPEVLDQILFLKLGEWYQFHPYNNSTECVGINQPDNQEATNSYVNGFNAPIVSACNDATPDDFLQTIETSKQAFKVEKRNLWDDGWEEFFQLEQNQQHGPGFVPEELEWTQPVKKMLNGYHDKYYLAGDHNFRENNKVEMEYDTGINNRDESLMPVLATIIDGVPYYYIQTVNGAHRLQKNTDGTLSLVGASAFLNINHLFTITHLDSENNFGALSKERDTISPEKVTGLQLTDVSRAEATLIWEEGTDNRGGQLHYTVTSSEGHTWSFDSSDNRSLKISLVDTEINSSRFYTVTAIDNNGNVSESSEEITLVTPSPEILPKPPVPVLSNIGADKSELTINLPYEVNEDISHIEIYRDGELITTQRYGFANIYTDYDIQPGKDYSYSYKIYYITGQKETAVSDNLLVSVLPEPVVNTPPSAPNNLEAQQYYPDLVFISWDHSTDDHDNNIKYKVYRDGQLLADSVYENYYIDYSVPSGEYTYHVIAEDSEGAETASSFAYVSVVVEEQPVIDRPHNLQGYQTGTGSTSAWLGWEYQNSDADTYYTVYRDGVMIIDELEDSYFEDTNLVPGNYSYTVTATDSEGQTTQHSDPIYIQMTDGNDVPIPIGNVQGSQMNPDSVRISWDYSSTPDVTYAVYRNGVMLQNGITDDFYIDTPVAAGNYIYYIKTINTLGEETMYGDSVFVGVVTE